MGTRSFAGKQVRLRELAPTDEPVVLAVFGDGKVVRWLPDEPFTPEATRRYVEASCSRASGSPRMEYVFVIERMDTGSACGLIWIGLRGNGDAIIRGALVPDAWGRGIAEECGEILRPFALEELALRRVWAGAHHRNLASRRVLEKLGFRSVENRVAETFDIRTDETCVMYVLENQARRD